MKKKGFTMIELMMVIAIIAIIAAVSIPMYEQYKRSAMRTEAMGELITLTASQEDCFNNYRKFCSGTELVSYYGAKMVGDHYKIEVTVPADGQSYSAEAFICYKVEGSACGSGNKDLRCVVTDTSDSPDCS